MQPLFNPCSMIYGDKPGRGMSITCGRCGHQGRKHVNTLRNTSGNDDEQAERLATRRFEDDGWKVGKSRAQHRCPDCLKEVRAAQMRAFHAKKEEPVATVVELKPGEPAAVEQQPREMSRADRRVIFAKLEDTYGDESTGYKPGWTDAKLAADLAVPVEWVKNVREENFGPTASNPAIDALLAEARAWRADIVTLVSTADEINARFKALAKQGEAIERKVDEIKKQVGLT